MPGRDGAASGLSLSLSAQLIRSFENQAASLVLEPNYSSNRWKETEDVTNGTNDSHDRLALLLPHW